MKKLLLTLLLALTLGAGAAWAAERSFELVKDASTLAAGDNVVIAGTYNGYDYAMGKTTSSSKIVAKSVTITNETITLDDANTEVNIFTLESDKTDSKKFALKTSDGKYVISGSKTDTKFDIPAYYAEIKISNNNATIATNSSRTLRLYQGKDFRGYADSSNQPVRIYKEVSTTPTKVTSNPAADAAGVITIQKGATITFSSKNAAQLKYSIDAGEYVTVEGNTFEFAPKEDISLFHIYPIDKNGVAYDDSNATDCSFMCEIKVEAALLCGNVTFDPADGSAVVAGSKVTISCENAAKIVYVVGNGEQITTDGPSTEVPINEACNITAYGINADGINSDPAEASYTIKEVDIYKLITKAEDIKDGARYVIAAATSKTEVLALSNKHNSKDKIPPVSLNIENDLVTVSDPSTVAIFEITKNGDNYQLKNTTSNNWLNTGTNTNATYSTDVINYTLTFDSDCVQITNTTGTTRNISYSTDNNANVFGYYAKSNNSKDTYTLVSLYRLLEPAPKAMYIHGHFWDRYYDFSQPVEMTADESGKVFTAEGIFIGGNEEASQNGFALSYVFSDSKAEATVPAGRAVDGVDWSGLEGNIYHQNGTTHTLTGNTEEIEPWIVAKEGRYDITADFSGFTPVFNAKESISTGIEGIGVDAAEAVYYNLQGVRVANPANGIYIRRQGAAVSKVYVK